LSKLEHSSAELPLTLASVLIEAKRWVVMTGSGVSAESGVPTFRDAQSGLWAQYEPQQLATPEAFESNPEIVWQWYQWRRKLIRKTTPNAAHTVLARLQRLKPELILVTQNVDGLHQRAGSTEVIEFHGCIERNKCFGCEKRGPKSDSSYPPTCNTCNGLMRPDVVWFGENIPTAALTASSDAVNACDVFFSVGTSSLVYPATALAKMALSRKATTIEINPNSTPLSTRMDFTLQGPAGLWLPVIASLFDKNS